MFGMFKNASATAKSTVLVEMTEVGRGKLENQLASGREYDILSAMVTLQPCNANEIAERLGRGATESKILDTLRAMKEKQWVRVHSG
jgi:hypothetical protein